MSRRGARATRPSRAEALRAAPRRARAAATRIDLCGPMVSINRAVRACRQLPGRVAPIGQTVVDKADRTLVAARTLDAGRPTGSSGRPDPVTKVSVAKVKVKADAVQIARLASRTGTSAVAQAQGTGAVDRPARETATGQPDRAASEIGALAEVLAAVPTGQADIAAADRAADLATVKVDARVVLAAADQVDLAEVESMCLL
jgi:hypothetical protein